MRHWTIGLVVAGTLVGTLAGMAVAQGDQTDATVTLSDGSVAVGLGFTWGGGTLNYKGNTYHVKVEGLSVGEIGVTRARPGVAIREAVEVIRRLLAGERVTYRGEMVRLEDGKLDFTPSRPDVA